MTPALNLPALVLSRIGSATVFMTYPACLPVLRDQWGMSATEAGTVQGAFTIAFAVSLLLTSLLSDRIGARTVFRWGAVLGAVTAIVFAAVARDFQTALVTVTLVGLAQGGTYTPSLMLASSNSPAENRSSVMGWTLAGLSGGFALSIAVSGAAMAVGGYVLAFWVTGLITAASTLPAFVAVRHARDTTGPATAQEDSATTMHDRRSARLLILGYIGHTWELMGAWAWVPAFLAMAAATQASGISGLTLGLWTALALHVTGFFASFSAGRAADRFGIRRVLIGFAVLGATCSLVIGWLPAWGAPLWLIFGLAALYGFATIGDSAVLSSAMSQAVPMRHLGKVLGLRSITGMGAGGVAPIAMGAVLDAVPGAAGWGDGFAVLGAGGALAVLCAALLRR